MLKALEDISVLPYKRLLLVDKEDRAGLSFYLNDHRTVEPETLLPEERKEFPVEEWIMPAQPDGYIRARDIDLL